MPLTFECPSCREKIITFLHAGEVATCRNCGSRVKVPVSAAKTDERPTPTELLRTKAACPPERAGEESKGREEGEFRYNNRYAFGKLLNCGFPFLVLLILLAYWMFEVEPSRGSVLRLEFKWWVPYFAVGLIIWAIFQIWRAGPVFRFRMRLSEEGVTVNNEQASWTNITKVEFKEAFGGDPAIVLHVDDGRMLKIPAAIESSVYVRGFIEAHARSSGRSNG